jgi:NTE family protein
LVIGFDSASSTDADSTDATGALVLRRGYRAWRETDARTNRAANAVLLKELRMIALLRQVANPGNSEGAQWAGMRIHRVASEMLTELGASSKLNAEWEFFSLLHDEGRRSAQVFLETHALDLGRRSTLDLDILLQSV